MRVLMGQECEPCCVHGWGTRETVLSLLSSSLLFSLGPLPMDDAIHFQGGSSPTP